MASAYYSKTQHIDFESVLAMDDPGMVSMFQAIMASGLEGFLGCPAVIYEAALVDFFENASVRDDVIISIVAGQLVEISEEWFAESFDLPVDGLADLSEIPKDVVFDARSIVSMSGEPVSLSGKKSQLKIEYRLLCDIMAKSISVKAGSFNAITVEKFTMLTAVVYGVMQTLNVITDQLSELVAYINRGGNDKKGEVSSSRPPPDNQNRGSGNTCGGGGDTVRPTDIPQRDIDIAQRNILERLMAADRQRERERGSRSRSGSHKRRRY
ncbi:hypothetical protein F511_12457 [Dorcoceras hygrometricum]|uniref:Dystroglycan-like n=1 Tax=Dorcoceras hygrometricum TaxID=472368 RepID=A0A2Z7BJN9_9LAMI|nr:hypothetical protein F511_12457 [Dorcoceras hygrometricum]